jgi:hypothetical protein
MKSTNEFGGQIPFKKAVKEFFKPTPGGIADQLRRIALIVERDHVAGPEKALNMVGEISADLQLLIDQESPDSKPRLTRKKKTTSRVAQP